MSDHLPRGASIAFNTAAASTSTGEDSGHTGTASISENMHSSTATATVTATATSRINQIRAEGEILPLTLRARPTGVTWDDDVEDNEGLGRKSSKRCCIFHKQRPFGESSTDSNDDSDASGSSSSSGGFKDMNRRRIARPKQKKTVPNYQRHHA